MTNYRLLLFTILFAGQLVAGDLLLWDIEPAFYQQAEELEAGTRGTEQILFTNSRLRADFRPVKFEVSAGSYTGTNLGHDLSFRRLVVAFEPEDAGWGLEAGRFNRIDQGYFYYLDGLTANWEHQQWSAELSGGVLAPHELHIENPDLKMDNVSWGLGLHYQMSDRGDLEVKAQQFKVHSESTALVAGFEYLRRLDDGMFKLNYGHDLETKNLDHATLMAASMFGTWYVQGVAEMEQPRLYLNPYFQKFETPPVTKISLATETEFGSLPFEAGVQTVQGKADMIWQVSAGSGWKWLTAGGYYYMMSKDRGLGLYGSAQCGFGTYNTLILRVENDQFNFETDGVNRYGVSSSLRYQYQKPTWGGALEVQNVLDTYANYDMRVLARCNYRLRIR